MAENTATPRDRFIEAIAEALRTFGESAWEFDFLIDDDSIVHVGFYDARGEIGNTLTADLSTLTVTEEN